MPPPGRFLRPVGCPPILGESGVEEVYVGFSRLLCKRPPGLLLFPRLVGQLRRGGLPALGLLSEVIHHPLGEVLSEAPLALLRVGGLFVDDPVGLGEGLGEPRCRLVHVAFASSIHHVLGSFP